MIRKRTVSITIITTIFMTCLHSLLFFSAFYFSLLLAYSSNFMVFFYPTTKSSSICISLPVLFCPLLWFRLCWWCDCDARWICQLSRVYLFRFILKIRINVADWWGRGWVYNEWWMDGFSTWLYNRKEKMIIAPS